ncbi:MAG: ABC transporter ATP-binding protein [Muribaculaceae bacterium]|nr:ABC transporter ATP-binding protein [Muribaculaceae bacterium]
MNPIIELRRITQRFEEREVLKAVSLQVAAGEILGLLGPSGAGKTTIIKIVTGQLNPTSGTVMIEGKDLYGQRQTLYRKMGMMMDEVGLYDRLSGYDNLKLFARIYELPEERIHRALELVGLSEAKKRPAAKLSKGMKSRLALARAVMSEPEFLFLDEPTSGLDPVTTQSVHRLIQEEQKHGATIFLTTHNMAEAEKLCHHVALLHEGQIVEYGEPKEICRNYNHQNKLHIRLRDGSCLTMNNDSSAAETVGKYLESQMIETIHSTEPNLETVFIELTGRSLCDCGEAKV